VLAIFLFLLMGCLAAVASSEPTVLPLPRQALYQSSGLSMGMGIGSVGRRHCHDMRVWQAQLDYAYGPVLSGGADMKVYGGNADEQSALVYQRYSLHAKWNKAGSRYNLYFGPVFGFDNTDLKEMRKEVVAIGDGVANLMESSCAETYGTQGVSFGYEAGMGALLHPDWGVVVANYFDMTTDSDVLFAVSMGLSFNVRNYWERLQRATQGCWLSVEWRSNLPISTLQPANSYVIGVSLGF
jgi:hypothetical protein